MAVPTLTSNSPVAGSIAWTAFKIRFEGTVYAVAAGSTAQRFVWWKYNNGAPTITGGAEAPDDLTPDDLLLFMNKDGIPFNLQNAQVVDGSLIVDGSILAPSLAVGIIDSNHIVTDGLDAGVIKFGLMSGDRLESTAIDGMTITGALFRTAATGARVEISAVGLLQYDAVNTLVSKISTTGDNYFSGIVDAKSIMVRDGLELFGQNNVFGSGSKVTLATGQAGSQTAPTMATYYDTDELADNFTMGYWYLRGYWENSAGTESAGVANEYSGDTFLFGPGNKKFQMGNNTNGFRVTKADGVNTRRYTHGTWYTRFSEAGGVSPKAAFISNITTDGYNETYTHPHIVVVDDSTMNSAGTARPTILLEKKIMNFNWWMSFCLGRVTNRLGGSTVGVEQLFAFCRHYYPPDATSDWIEMSLQDYVGNDVVDNFFPGQFNFAPHRVHSSEKVIGIHYGAPSGLRFAPNSQDDVLGNCWLLQTTHQNIILKGDLSTRYTQWEWPVIPGNVTFGFTKGDIGTAKMDKFGVVTGGANLDAETSSRIIWYSNWTWSGGSTADKRIWGQFAWRGHSSKAPEWLTPPSAMSEPFVPAKRSMVSLSVPGLPPPEAGVNAARDINKDVYGWVLYLGQSTNQPGNAAMFRHNNLSPAGDPTNVTSVLFEGFPVLSGSNPLASTQGFPSTSPARIVSSAASGGVPLLSIDGDGNITAKSINVKRIAATSNTGGNTNYNVMTESGWYVMDSAATGSPNGATCFLEVRSYASVYVEQVARHVITGAEYTRYMNNGVWGAWSGGPVTRIPGNAGVNSSTTYFTKRGGMVTLHFEITCPSGVAFDTLLMQAPSGYAPQARIFFNAYAVGQSYLIQVTDLGNVYNSGQALPAYQFLGSVSYAHK